MRKGDKGAQVETLQRALVRLGHALPKHGVDGDLGGETLGAARAFARAHGIEEPVDELPKLFVEVVVGLAALAAHRATEPAVVEGVDVSGWQRPSEIDWHEAREDGVEFVFVKASQGVGGSRRFAAHWRAAGEAGLLRGAYHFAELRSPARRARPEKQAENLVRRVEARGDGLGELPLVLDLEWQRYPGKTKAERAAARAADIGPQSALFGATQVVAWAERFGARIEQLSGSLPILYTGASFWTYRLGATDALAHWRLWQAAYTGDGVERPAPEAAPTSMTPPWGSLTFWQFAGMKGRAPDGDGDGERFFGQALDRNLFFGSPDELRGLRDALAT